LLPVTILFENPRISEEKNVQTEREREIGEKDRALAVNEGTQTMT